MFIQHGRMRSIECASEGASFGGGWGGGGEISFKVVKV